MQFYHRNLLILSFATQIVCKWWMRIIHQQNRRDNLALQIWIIYLLDESHCFQKRQNCEPIRGVFGNVCDLPQRHPMIWCIFADDILAPPRVTGYYTTTLVQYDDTDAENATVSPAAGRRASRSVCPPDWSAINSDERHAVTGISSRRLDCMWGDVLKPKLSCL